MRRVVLLLLGAASLAACAPEVRYVYRPAEQATAIMGSRLAARYGVPPESPRGNVRVASFGIAKIETTGGEVHPLHVRLSIANNNDTGPWELDARLLRAHYATGEIVEPMFVNAPASGEPQFSIAPGEAAEVDAYFPLPPGVEGAEGVPKFDLTWSITTPDREVAERTPFERIRIEPEPTAQTGCMPGLWAGWWYDPLYAPIGPTVIIEQRPREYGPPRGK